jgi:hypothetical protein
MASHHFSKPTIKPNYVMASHHFSKPTTRLSEQFQTSIEIAEIGTIDISNTQNHDRTLSWLDTGTSIKSGRVKLVL